MTLAKASGKDDPSRSQLAVQQEHGHRSLSRSRQPYHRRRGSLVDGREAGSPSTARLQEQTSTATESSSTESGTEADDERGPILKSLPAPPSRTRKGLKGTTPANLTPAISPLPTPPAIIHEGRLAFFDRLKQVRGRPAVATESKTTLDQYLEKKRAEVVRRCTETLLLSFIGVAVFAGSDRRSKSSIELATFGASVTCVYFSYPLRVSGRIYRKRWSVIQALEYGFHIPSRFDPGPLLYPVFLPLLISMSLGGTSSQYLLANLILGLASIPQSVVFSGLIQQQSTYLHWAISALPLVSSSQRLATKPEHIPGVLKSVVSLLATGEEMILLYPLHQAVLLVLRYLTTSSLDPVEIQLLSTGLINLLLYAASPQAQILKALMWLGGLSLFVSCRNVLEWEVALARIPAWKFSRGGKNRAGLAAQLHDLLCSVLSKSKLPRLSSISSDSDEYEPLPKARVKRKANLRLHLTPLSDNNQDRAPMSAVDDTSRSELLDANATMGDATRMNTLSTSGGETALPKNFVEPRRKRAGLAFQSPFLQLTYAQAQIRKWLYALFTYVVVAVVVLIPIRQYVRVWAVSSHEPVGWALGYLLGNWPTFRVWVVSNNHERWIALPQYPANMIIGDFAGWLEDYRQTNWGPANVRLALCVYCVLVLSFGIGVVFRLQSVVAVDTRRKVFHGIMVAMLLPTVFVDPCFIALALTLILAIFLLLDLFRAAQLPPVSRPLTRFLAPYVDGRDHRGPVIVSPIFLLIGCAIPLWLSLAGATRTGQQPWIGWETDQRELGMVSGVICVGMGDAAASLIGRRYGKTKWYWGGGKSLEGSIAFAVAVMAGLMASYGWLRIGGWESWAGASLLATGFKALVAGLGASLLESTLTAANDNVVVPIGLWLLVRGLRI